MSPALSFSNPSTSQARLAALARSFPTLAGRLLFTSAVASIDGATLRRELRSPANGSGARHALRFLCTVWNFSTPSASRFDAVEALRAWDDRHRSAFIAWASDPWWA